MRRRLDHACWNGTLLRPGERHRESLADCLSCPLIILTMGVFAVVIIVATPLLASQLARSLEIGFRVDGFGAAQWGTLFVGIVSFLLNPLIRHNREVRHRVREC